MAFYVLQHKILPQSFAKTFAAKFRHTAACRASKDGASLYE
jgi:hypothetical protein